MVLNENSKINRYLIDFCRKSNVNACTAKSNQCCVMAWHVSFAVIKLSVAQQSYILSLEHLFPGKPCRTRGLRRSWFPRWSTPLSRLVFFSGTLWLGRPKAAKQKQITFTDSERTQIPFYTYLRKSTSATPTKNIYT